MFIRLKVLFTLEVTGDGRFSGVNYNSGQSLKFDNLEMSLMSQIIERLFVKILSRLTLRKMSQRSEKKQLQKSNEIKQSKEACPECGQLVGSYYNEVECKNCGFQKKGLVTN